MSLGKVRDGEALATITAKIRSGQVTAWDIGDAYLKSAPEDEVRTYIKDLGFCPERPVFVRSVMQYWTGLLIALTPEQYGLVQAAYIPFDGERFADGHMTGNLTEVEPLPDDRFLVLERGAIVATIDWPHPLPREQK